MEFPTYQEWVTSVVMPDELDFMSTQGKYLYYKEKFEIALLCKAERPVIGEIGVRYGYSAASFCFAHPQATFYGWDVINGGHGGIKGGLDTFPYTKEMLARNFPNATVKLEHQDTQSMDKFEVEFDLFHVDGNHSTKGCCHDMEMVLASLKPGGLMIVDDYQYIGGVKRAVDAFLEQNDSRIENFEIRTGGLRGNALIWKPAI